MKRDGERERLGFMMERERDTHGKVDMVNREKWGKTEGSRAVQRKKSQNIFEIRREMSCIYARGLV